MNHPATINNFSAQLQKHLATPQALSVLRNLLILLFLIWCCFTLARLFWLLVPSPGLPETPSTTPRNTVATTAPKAGGASVDLEPLLAAEIFGALDASAPEPEVVEQTTVIDAEETKLNLVLKGVIRSSVATNSEAIIAHGRREESYKVGDSLPGGTRVKLVQVDAHRVILDNSGRTEALNLFDPSKLSSTPAPLPVGRSGSYDDEEDERQFEQDEQEQDDGDHDTTRAAVDGPGTAVIKQRPRSLSDVIRFSVAREGGDIIGYKIRPGRDRNTFSELGLQNNDIVTEINGIALTDSGSVTKVYQEMRHATSASVEILRDGQSLQVNIQLDTE